MCGQHRHRLDQELAPQTRSSVDTAADVRASAEDRDKVLAQLRLNTGAGRLDMDEFEERLDQAWQARTTGELHAVVADLPFIEAPEDRERRQRLIRKAILTPYLGVMALLIGIWLVSGAGYFWPVWPMFGWGIPVALQLRATAHHRNRPRRPAMG